LADRRLTTLKSVYITSYRNGFLILLISEFLQFLLLEPTFSQHSQFCVFSAQNAPGAIIAIIIITLRVHETAVRVFSF